MNVILDLDETLISTHRASKFTKRHRKRAKLFHSCAMEDKYIVIIRPGLDEFLDWLFSKFTVTIWTAASRSYALFIVKNLIMRKPSRVPLYVFSSSHCEVSQKYGRSHKDLKILFKIFPRQYNSQNTIIVDDHPDVCKNQQNESYCIRPFLFLKPKSYRDNDLTKLRQFLERWAKRRRQR